MCSHPECRHKQPYCDHNKCFLISHVLYHKVLSIEAQYKIKLERRNCIWKMLRIIRSIMNFFLPKAETVFWDMKNWTRLSENLASSTL